MGKRREDAGSKGDRTPTTLHAGHTPSPATTTKGDMMSKKDYQAIAAALYGIKKWRGAEHVTFCCGARMRAQHDDGGADEGFCSVCSAELCSSCASEWSREDGYGDDGQGVRTDATCKSCHADREERRQYREWRKDSGV